MTVRRIAVDHVLFVVEDLGASRRLYTAALAPLGYFELHVQEDGVHYGAEGLDDFSIYRGAPVMSAAHVAFDARDRSARQQRRGRLARGRAGDGRPDAHRRPITSGDVSRAQS